MGQQGLRASRSSLATFARGPEEGRDCPLDVQTGSGVQGDSGEAVLGRGRPPCGRREKLDVLFIPENGVGPLKWKKIIKIKV